MKRAFLFFTCLFCSLALFAQEHLTFKGIPIDGNIRDFSQKLEDNGYSPNYGNSSDAFRWFDGDFMGKQSVILVPFTSSGLVFKVFALHEYSSWSRLSSAFDDAVELYQKKYGKPDYDFKFFSSPYYEGDGYELQALRNDKCHYYFAWQLENGVISVSLQYLVGKYYIRYAYEDAINQDRRDTEKESKALDDI